MFKKIILFLLLIPVTSVAQHTISGTFTPAEKFKFAILYKVTPTTSMYIANAEIKENGAYEFKLDSTITKGIYRMVYALPQEENNFDLIYNAEEDIEVNFNFEEGETYTASKENELLQNYYKGIALASEKIKQFYASNSTNEKKYLKLFKELKEIQDEFEKAAKGTIAAHFITASKSYIPTQYEDQETYIKNVKAYYLTPIDFSDTILQSSNFLIESVVNYVLQFNPEKTDAVYMENIDHVMKAVGYNGTVKEVLLKVLWNQFSEIPNEVVTNYISEKYLLPIARANSDNELIYKLTTYTNTSIGKKAPNFTLEIPNEEGKVDLISLHKYNNSNQYIIVFWSSTCSHCLKELPKLRDFLKPYQTQDIQVIAVGLEDTPYRWKDTTYDFPNFIHVYGEGKWDNPIGDAYGVTATPTYFILDADKNIIAKPNDFEAFKKYFNETH